MRRNVGYSVIHADLRYQDRRKTPRGCAAHIIRFTHRSLYRRLLVNSMVSSRADSTMKHLLIICLLYTLFQAAFAAKELASPCTRIAYSRTNDVGFRCTELTTLQDHLDKARTNTTIITIFDSNIPNILG